LGAYIYIPNVARTVDSIAAAGRAEASTASQEELGTELQMGLSVPIVQPDSVRVAGDPFAGLPACPYQNTGSPQPVELEELSNGLYRFDPESTGCAFIVEGRFPWQTRLTSLAGDFEDLGILADDGSPWYMWDVHNIVVGRSREGNFPWGEYNRLVEGGVIPSQYLEDMICLGCSVWLYDPDWNMGDVTTPKPPIALELEAAKYEVMLASGYLFPRVVWQPDEDTFIYYEVSSGAEPYEACTSGDEPEQIAVHGLAVEDGFVAAIGKTDCTTVAWIDGELAQWEGQRDGENIVTFTRAVEAWMMPAGFTQVQIDAWVAAH
jgi:hypothetical protein